MTPTFRSSRSPRRATLAAGTITALLALGAAAGVGSNDLASAQPAAHRVVAPSGTPTTWKARLLNPKHKYYGISVSGAPHSMSGVQTVTKETGKQPNLLMFFESWGSGAAKGKPNIDINSIRNACNQGMLPMLTWQSWDGAQYTQPGFAPARIASGAYDTYIKKTAQEIKSLGASCPIALRFDHEQNGYWYPWGVSTAGMPGTQAQRAASYIKMWRHVWNIFNHQGVTNVLWTWSPNYQSLKHKGLPSLAATYPGDKYVDWVGVDAYYNASGVTFAQLFDPTISQLDKVAPGKPWIIAETGVGTFSDKASEITNLLHAVGHRSKFNGVIYFDQHASRNDWKFDTSQSSLSAFRTGIRKKVYAAGKPGTL